MRSLDPDRAAIEELSRAFSAAYMRGDAVAMAAPYTPDAVIVPGGSEMIAGREASQRLGRDGRRMHLDVWNSRPQPRP